MKKFLLALFVGIGLVSGLASLGAYAACTGTACINEGANNAQTGSTESDTLPEVIKIVTNALLFIIGAVSVIYIVIGGMKYVTANGDNESIKSAKNTLLYSVIGVIAAICAYAIVEFVIDIF